MEKIASLLKRPIVRVGLALLVLLILGGAAGGIYLTQQSPEQPIQFPHNKHVAAFQIPCLYCHSGAATGPVAGLPGNSKCWGCHQQIAKTKTSPELIKLTDFVNKNQPIPWVPVAIEPDFVHFNHRPHVAAGVACETCHGDIKTMTVAQVPFVQNMGWCLDCHKKMRPQDFVRLSDCSTCHY